MAEESITYARGRIVELDESINAMRIQLEPIKKAICSKTCADTDINVYEVRVLLNEYESKISALSEKQKERMEIKEKWGLR